MNKITCICLGVRNMERSMKFYRDGLGFKTDCKEDNRHSAPRLFTLNDF